MPLVTPTALPKRKDRGIPHGSMMLRAWDRNPARSIMGPRDTTGVHGPSVLRSEVPFGSSSINLMLKAGYQKIYF